VETWLIVSGAMGALGAALYGLHRLALRLERRGYPYYRHAKPQRGAGGAFVALQRIVEPDAEHVQIVGESSRRAESDAAGGPPPLRLRPPGAP